MTGFENALLLLLLLTALSVAGRRLPWPLPITYVVGATAVAFWPAFPRIELEPGFFFLCFVPPLLFADGWLMPLRDFREAKGPVIALATGLVVFTTVTVGFVAHWLIPGLPLAMAFALGAVISPTDAVAVAAITQRLKVPARLNAVLNGESLMNDATGLVAFKFALGAVLAGTFSIRAAGLEFLVLAGGGLALGLALAWFAGALRDLLQRLRGADPFIEVTVSLMTPYAAYLAADALGLSTILAVVAAGLYSGWRDPLRMDVATRQTTWTVWSVALFWLNGLAFVLLGLQLPSILTSLSGDYSAVQLASFTATVAGIAIAARLLWVFAHAGLARAVSRHAPVATEATWRGACVAGWAGMRGTITLAAALSIPLALADGTPFPGRDLVIFLSAGTIVVTLLVQGTTLEWLICRLGVRADETQVREERLARVTAVEAGLNALRGQAGGTSTPEATAALGEVIAEYEHRLAELTAEGESRSSARRRRTAGRGFRLDALRAERAAIDDLWSRNVITDEIHRPLQQLLDHEEAMLAGQPDPKSAA